MFGAHTTPQGELKEAAPLTPSTRAANPGEPASKETPVLAPNTTLLITCDPVSLTTRVVLHRARPWGELNLAAEATPSAYPATPLPTTQKGVALRNTPPPPSVYPGANTPLTLFPTAMYRDPRESVVAALMEG